MCRCSHTRTRTRAHTHTERHRHGNWGQTPQARRGSRLPDILRLRVLKKCETSGKTCGPGQPGAGTPWPLGSLLLPRSAHRQLGRLPGSSRLIWPSGGEGPVPTCPGLPPNSTMAELSQVSSLGEPQPAPEPPGPLRATQQQEQGLRKCTRADVLGAPGISPLSP